MISFKCKNCGGEMNVSRSGDLFCSYCGTKAVFSDSELREYRDFRGRMLDYLSAVANTNGAPEETEFIWSRAEKARFCGEDSSPIEISWLFKGEQDGVTVYTARHNVLFVFKSGDERAAGFFKNVEALEFPSADVRELGQYFPKHGGTFRLKDGGVLLAVNKPETVFPLSAFGSLPPEHAAWVISRLENLCCVLAYSGLAHNGIGMDSVFIDAGRHSMYLLGGWWNAHPSPEGSRGDLLALRETAKRVLGVYCEGSPKMLKDFLSGEPKANAYEDFAAWDAVIKEAFGGRKFVRLDLGALKI